MDKKRVNRRTALLIAIKVKKMLTPFGKVKITGSLRRGERRVGDVDLVGNNQGMMEVFLSLGEVIKGQPDGKQANILIDGVQVDLWITPDESWNTMLMHTTGSMAENIWLRGIAKKSFRTLNQWGLWQGPVNIARGLTEMDVYNLLGVNYRRPNERKGWDRV
jgi:DNA polymerase/3'-5' exonuclease PolX